MGQCTTLKTGQDVELYISDTNTACAMYTAPPVPARRWQIPVANAQVLKAGTTVNLGTLAALLTDPNFIIPAGMWVGIVVNGVEYPVKLSASLVGNATAPTSITFEATSTIIPASASSYFTWPVLVTEVTSVTNNDNKNIVTGESGVSGFAPSAVGLGSGTMDIAMEENPMNAGQLNIEYFQSIGQTCVLSVFDPQYRTGVMPKLVRALGVFGTITRNRPRNTQLTKTANFALVRAPELTLNKADS